MFLSYVWASFSHSSCTPHASYPCSYLLFFPSFLLIVLSICDKKGESILESIQVCIVISIWFMCTLLGRESYRGDAYTKGEKTFSLFCFGLYYSCALSRIVPRCIYTSCILHWSSVGHAFILMLLCFIDCMFGWSFALLYDHCGHFHMTVICLIKLFICFTTCLLDHILLVILYLSFYHLIYLEGLMCFVQVF